MWPNCSDVIEYCSRAIGASGMTMTKSSTFVNCTAASRISNSHSDRLMRGRGRSVGFM